MADDDNSKMFPVALNEKTLFPGAIIPIISNRTRIRHIVTYRTYYQNRNTYFYI